MTAKDKAKQLYDKMKFETEFNSQPSTVNGMCKKLALICVDEILNSHIDSVYEAYYLDVKKEIEKL
ncbi:hypothetical protein N9E82_00745 [bacterium]|nr:hypothetical protein [bacterium]